MQKISSYLYKNRINVFASLPSYADDTSNITVEYTKVEQRIVKIYSGIDNTIEFDVKNYDQKRIDLHTLQSLEMNVMDASGYSLSNSPYAITVTSARGIGSVTIPAADLSALDDQYLKFSLTAKDSSGKDVLLYVDTYFNATGKLQLIGNAMPIIREERVYDTFIAEIDLQGMPIYHSSAIPVKFYEAESTETVNLEIQVAGFIGSIWIDATTSGTIINETFIKAGKPFGSWTNTVNNGPYTGIIPYGSNIPIGDYQYIRVSYTTNVSNGIGANFIVTKRNNVYDVTIKSSGTGYGVGSQIKIKGSQLGGVDGINDLIITVTGINASTAGFISSYTVSGISSIQWEGTASNNAGTFLASGVNISGMVNKVIVY